MIVVANMSKDVYEYFKEYDMSDVANTLLDMFDFTNLPATSGERYKEVRLDIKNEYYISLYQKVGARSKLVSLARLFEYAYNIDVLSLDRFKIFKVEAQDFPEVLYLHRAYKALKDAQLYDQSPELTDIVSVVYQYWRIRENEKQEKKANKNG